MEVEMSKIRLQIMLTPEEHQLLKYLSGEKKTSIADLIRKAIDSVYSDVVSIEEKKEKVLKTLFSLNMEVSDWPEMKKEIILGAMGEQEK